MEKLGVIFLQETKCSKIELKIIGGKVWKGCEAIAVDANKVVGGIGILWNPKEVSLFNFSATQHFLYAAFHILGTCIWGFMTNVYGLPRAEQKIQFLDSLRMINGMPKGKPWIIGGDFNLIRNLEEKKGGIRQLNPINYSFNEVIDNLELIDVRKNIDTFNWNNKRTGDRGIARRLDCFLVSESIMMNEGELKGTVLPSARSYHWPIKLEWKNVGTNLRKPFRFKKLWLLQPDFPEKLKEWWEEIPTIRGTRMYQFQPKLKILKSKIKKWNKESFGNMFQAKAELDKKIKEVQTKGM